jgi:heme-degrading monooxygenase HmoA
MFSVLFEVQPRRDEWDVYLARADMRRADLEQTPGFVDNIHYSSLTRDGWILSLSGWRDEDSILRWHERRRGDEGYDGQLVPDHRLRVGEVTSDTGQPEDHEIVECGPYTGDAGEGTYVTLIDAKQTLEWVSTNNPQEIAIYLGFDLYSYGDCISWDIFDSLSDPGEIILVVTWKDAQSANDHAATQIVPDDARVRVLRIVRDHSAPDSSQASADPPADDRAAIGA